MQTASASQPKTDILDQLNSIEQFAGMYCMADLRCVVPPFHREMYELAIGGHKRIVICAPRAFAKSTVFSKIYPLYQILQGGASKILIISATGTLAEHWLSAIRRELEENLFILDEKRGYGNVRTDKWTQSHLIIQRRDGTKCEVYAKGAGYQIRGFRPDIIIVDDIETDEGVRSDDQREKLLDWFNKALLNTLEKDSQLIMIGTLLHPLALLADVMRREGWVSRKYQALDVVNEDGVSLWPEKWPTEALLERSREIGMRAFNSEFQNDPVVSENPIFVREWFGRITDEIRKAPATRTGIACDPAIARTETADYTAIGVISDLGKLRLNKKTYRVGEVLRGHWPINRTVTELIGLYDRSGASFIVIETTAYQQALADEVRRYCDENHRNINIIEVKPDKDKERRAHAVAPMLERGEVFFDYGDPMHQKLMDELFLFPTGSHDDLVDFFVYDLAEHKRHGEVKKSTGPHFNDPPYHIGDQTGIYGPTSVMERR